MQKTAESACGEITVFFALALTLIFALLLSVTESARVQAARLYLTQAVNASIDSLFSQYHEQLWTDYRLLGLEHYSNRQLEEETEMFLRPYLAAKNWYPVSEAKAALTDKQKLTEEDGALFEREVLDYMKYGITASVIGETDAEKLLQAMSEAGATEQMTGLYDAHSRSAVRLEKKLEAIADCLKEQEIQWKEAKQALEDYDGNTFIRKAEGVIQQLNMLPERIAGYQEAADQLEKELAVSREQLEAAYGEGKLSEATYQNLLTDVEEYESYAAKDGARRQEMEALMPRSADDIQLLENLIEEARTVQETIDLWQPDDEDDELDEGALWAPLIKELEQYDLLVSGVSYGIGNEEKEGWLENVRSLFYEKMLDAILPADVQPSRKDIIEKDFPSKTEKGKDHISRRNLGERIYLSEYFLQALHYYGRDRYGTHPNQKGSGFYEAEYILNGKQNDYENLEKTAERLLALRTGLNLIYLYQAPEKRIQARTLALELTGAFGFTPLVGVMLFFIMGVWAVGQAACDVRDLLHGRKTPFFHNQSSFYLELDDLLTIGRTGRLPEPGQEQMNETSGMAYPDYLRLFLIAGAGTAEDYRSMDMIQASIRRQQADFLLNKCIVSANMKVTAQASHLFTELGIVLGETGRKIPRGYQMQVQTSYQY